MCNTTILPVFILFIFFTFATVRLDFLVICCILPQPFKLLMLSLWSVPKWTQSAPCSNFKDTKIASAYFFSHFSLFTFYAERWDEVIIALHKLRTSITGYQKKKHSTKVFPGDILGELMVCDEPINPHMLWTLCLHFGFLEAFLYYHAYHLKH